MDDLILKEYNILRNEIDQQTSLHNTLTTFIITCTVAVITIAASEQIPILYLFPFCIIIPMNMRIAFYRKAMAKISGYMIVFLEPKLDGINWETRNLYFQKKYGGASTKKHKFNLWYSESLTISVVCYLLYVFSYLSGKVINFLTILYAFAPAFLLVWVCVITHRINRVDKDREEMVRIWEKIKNEIS